MISILAISNKAERKRRHPNDFLEEKGKLKGQHETRENEMRKENNYVEESNFEVRKGQKHLSHINSQHFLIYSEITRCHKILADESLFYSILIFGKLMLENNTTLQKNGKQKIK